MADYAALGLLLRPILLAYKTHRSIRYLPDFVHYLRQAHPTVVLAALTPANLVAVWAQLLADIPMRVIISEHNTLSQMIAERAAFWRWRFLPPLLKRVYAHADGIIAVSDGAADDLAQSTGLSRACITTIYNPVVTPDLLEQTRAPLDHAWFAARAAPVVLGVGRLAKQKDFPTLLRAFARVLKTRAVRLIILGEGPERERLESLAQQLGIAAKVELPGFVDNPFAYMARAKVFVLSSRYEGFGNVLVEAMACDCPVVSTDCPRGPAEILGHAHTGQEHSKNCPSSGLLVPVGDELALANAMLTVLVAPFGHVDDAARERRHSRAAQFSVEHAVDRYLEVLRNV
jgi:glycosyltransferase involved in cell wall biosynthesis